MYFRLKFLSGIRLCTSTGRLCIHLRWPSISIECSTASCCVVRGANVRASPTRILRRTSYQSLPPHENVMLISYCVGGRCPGLCGLSCRLRHGDHCFVYSFHKHTVEIRRFVPYVRCLLCIRTLVGTVIAH